jgi:hypothetical protein
VAISESQLDGLLVGVDDVDTIMGTRSLAAHPVESQMADNRNLLPNLNCLGVWQVGESAIYGEQGNDGWQAMRLRLMRTPDTDDWDTLAVQAVVIYPTPDAARAFFDQSADRWSKCTNHHVNITLNDKPLPKWLSGDLGRTDTRLAMPISRGGGDTFRACQHVLDVTGNLVVDAQTCTSHGTTPNEAAQIADRITAAAGR